MSLELINPDDVREKVREHYAERVRTASSCCGTGGSSSCCSPSAIDFETDGTWGVALYSADELAEVPEDAATGIVRYSVTAKDSQGRTGEWKPFDVEASQLTIVE